METIKFSQNWNNKLLLDSYFTTIRIFNNNKHVKGALIKCEYARKGETVDFVTEIAEVATVMLDAIPEFLFLIDTGYNKEQSIKMFEQMYKNKQVDIHSVKFAVICLKHRPDLQQKAS